MPSLHMMRRRNTMQAQYATYRRNAMHMQHTMCSTTQLLHTMCRRNTMQTQHCVQRQANATHGVQVHHQASATRNVREGPALGDIHTEPDPGTQQQEAEQQRHSPGFGAQSPEGPLQPPCSEAVVGGTPDMPQVGAAQPCGSAARVEPLPGLQQAAVVAEQQALSASSMESGSGAAVFPSPVAVGGPPATTTVSERNSVAAEAEALSSPPSEAPCDGTHAPLFVQSSFGARPASTAGTPQVGLHPINVCVRVCRVHVYVCRLRCSPSFLRQPNFPQLDAAHRLLPLTFGAALRLPVHTPASAYACRAAPHRAPAAAAAAAAAAPLPHKRHLLPRLTSPVTWPVGACSAAPTLPLHPS